MSDGLDAAQVTWRTTSAHWWCPSCPPGRKRRALDRGLWRTGAAPLGTRHDGW